MLYPLLILHWYYIAVLTGARPTPSESLNTLDSPWEQCCWGALNTKMLIFPFPAFPVKRAREDHEALGSSIEPQKKRQKDERKTGPDGSSPSASSHR